MTLRLLFSRLLLSCVLLGAQQMGWTHALSHLRTGMANGAATAAARSALSTPAAAAGNVADRSASNPNGTLQADKACEQCLAFAQIDAVLAACGIGILPDGSPAPLLAQAAQPGLLPATACVFRSRAPPRLS